MPERSEIEAAALDALAASGTVLRQAFRAAQPSTPKADGSPVTEADRAAEAAIRGVLETRFPDHGVVGEELGGCRAGARCRWVLDPIDGTRAFLTGRPSFATLLAFLVDDDVVFGAIDQPVTGERWIAWAGEPTRFTGSFGGGIGARPCAGLDEAELSCTSPELLGEALPRFKRLAEAVRRVSWGGDAYQYGLLSLGLIDLVAETGLKLWDWAALVPVVEGAGGLMTDWSGAKLRPGCAGDVLALGNPALLAGAVSRLAA